MVKSQKYDIFISYRRDGGAYLARSLKEALSSRKYSVFLDIDSLGPGHFGDALLKQIALSKYFIVILSKDSLNTCSKEKDWMREEISQAIKCKKEIIPISDKDFTFPESESLAECIREVRNYTSIKYDLEFFNAVVDKICARMDAPSKVGMARKVIGALVSTLLLAILVWLFSVFLNIEPRFDFIGMVTDSKTGLIVPGANVIISNVVDGRTIEHHTTTSSEGKFFFNDIAFEKSEDLVSVSLSKEGYAAYKETAVYDRLSGNIQLSKIETPSYSIQAVVQEEKIGQALSDVAVSLTYESEGSSVKHNALTDSDGKFVFSDVRLNSKENAVSLDFLKDGYQKINYKVPYNKMPKTFFLEKIQAPSLTEKPYKLWVEGNSVMVEVRVEEKYKGMLALKRKANDIVYQAIKEYARANDLKQQADLGGWFREGETVASDVFSEDEIHMIMKFEK